MNYIKQVAEMLGVKIGEEFEINELEEESPKHKRFRLNADCESFLEYYDIKDQEWDGSWILGYILSGKYTIKKLPWKPIKCDKYWYYSIFDDCAYDSTWNGRTPDVMSWKADNCFKTRKEAETKGRKIMEQIKKEYEEK